jgi:hypothetical protein
MTTNSQKPVVNLRDGFLSASVWQNEGEKGSFYAVTFSRAYIDDAGKIQNTSSYSGGDLLKLSRLAEHAYDAIKQLVAENGTGHELEGDSSAPAPAKR